MRFLPDISYGTENYPEKVARRLRALNLIAWSTAAITIGFAVVDFLDPKPWLWKHVTICVLTALIWASIPFLHRLGILWQTLILVLTTYAHFFAIIYMFGTGTGLQMAYLVAGALTVVILGTEHILLSAVLGALAVLLVVILQIMVPYDTGLYGSRALFANFVAAAIITVTINIAIVTFALREAARADSARRARSSAIPRTANRIRAWSW